MQGANVDKSDYSNYAGTKIMFNFNKLSAALAFFTIIATGGALPSAANALTPAQTHIFFIMLTGQWFCRLFILRNENLKLLPDKRLFAIIAHLNGVLNF